MQHEGKGRPVAMSAGRERQLRSVNASVREEPDSVTEGAPDVWTVATNVGDCEDIAILKKKRLLALGWPASSLLQTVVRPQYGNEGHTLLTVRTSRGDLVLDNLDDTVRPWSATSYRYYARQSVVRQGSWSSSERRRRPPARPPASNRSRMRRRNRPDHKSKGERAEKFAGYGRTPVSAPDRDPSRS